VAVGDTINVIPPLFNITPFGMIPKMKPFRVVGIIQQRGGFIDTYFAYVSLSQAQHFLGLGDVASGVEVEVDNFDQAKPVAEALRSHYRFPYSVRSWEDLFGSFLAALNLEKLGLFIVLAIIVVVAAFNIATTLIMVVMEKHRDIAILRSMGATSRSIMRIFVLEGLIIGTLGTLLGTDPRAAAGQERRPDHQGSGAAAGRQDLRPGRLRHGPVPVGGQFRRCRGGGGGGDEHLPAGHHLPGLAGRTHGSGGGPALRMSVRSAA
jgi:hypothetical protein